MEGTKKDIVKALQEQIFALQGFAHAPSPKADGLTGLAKLESAFPGGRFPTGTIHEFICSSSEQAAASEGFIAALISRLMEKDSVCIWISKGAKVFPSSLGQFALSPEKIIFISLTQKKEILWTMEEALKCEGIAAVIAEIPEIDFAQSRRLQLATEKSRVSGFILRNATGKISATSCSARWQVSHLPSDPGELPGVGYPRWQIDLLKVRNGQPGSFQIEWLEDHFAPIETAEYLPLTIERAV